METLLHRHAQSAPRVSVSSSLPPTSPPKRQVRINCAALSPSRFPASALFRIPDPPHPAAAHTAAAVPETASPAKAARSAPRRNSAPTAGTLPLQKPLPLTMHWPSRAPPSSTGFPVLVSAV